MALHWRPVGPLPERTYWARRAGVVAAALLVLLVLRSCAGGDEPDRVATRAAPTPAASSAPTPRPSGAARPVVASCRDADLGVTVAPTPESSPRAFVVTVVNRGASACRRDLGPAVLDLVVTSGSDRVWTRSDCARGTARETIAFAAGASRAVRVAWDGRRSRPGCTGSRQAAAPGTYRVAGKVGSKPVPAAVFRVR